MGTRNRDLVFLGLAIAFLITSIVMVRRQTAALAPVQARPAAVTAPAAPPVTATAPVEMPGAGPLGKPARNPFAPPAPTTRHQTASALPLAPVAPPPPPAPPVATPAPAPAESASVLPPLAAPATTAVRASTGPVLLGVMIDGSSRKPTAVIRDGTRRYDARQGDKIAGQYTVQSVTSQMVVLVSSQGKLILKMGGS